MGKFGQPLHNFTEMTYVCSTAALNSADSPRNSTDLESRWLSFSRCARNDIPV